MLEVIFKKMQGHIANIRFHQHSAWQTTSVKDIAFKDYVIKYPEKCWSRQFSHVMLTLQEWTIELGGCRRNSIFSLFTVSGRKQAPCLPQLLPFVLSLSMEEKWKTQNFICSVFIMTYATDDLFPIRNKYKASAS